MNEAQKRAVKLKEEIERDCIQRGFNLTIYDGGIGFVDPKENKIVMVWKPQYKCGGSTEQEVERLKALEVGKTPKEVVNYSVAVLAEVVECARQEDAPIYEGDKEVDRWVRLSDVEEAINKHLN